MAELSKLAVLIDGDNTQPAIAAALLEEIAKYGIASVKRVYGDWTTQQLSGWKKVLAEQALQPIQQFAYTSGKNATDGAMIIDAMDLLYTQRFDGFCLVSSDSDFTGLAKRLRQNGLTVYGFGERKTPQSLRAACDKFIYLDVLRGAAKAVKVAEPAAPVAGKDAVKPVAKPAAKPAAKTAKVAKKAGKPAPAASPVPAPQGVEPGIEVANEARSESREARAEAKPDARTDAELHRLFAAAHEDAADEDGWASLGTIGSLIAKRRPDFDSRNWGYKKLSELALAVALFETDERKSADGKQKTLFLRLRRAAKPA